MSEAFRRRCMACNTTKNKYDLIRIVRTKDNEVLVDKTGKIDGRGAYICKDIKCLEKVIKTNRFKKVLNININNKIYDDIRGVIIDNEIENQNK